MIVFDPSMIAEEMQEAFLRYVTAVRADAAAEEREACAKVVIESGEHAEPGSSAWCLRKDLAAAIRARGKK